MIVLDDGHEVVLDVERMKEGKVIAPIDSGGPWSGSVENIRQEFSNELKQKIYYEFFFVTYVKLFF